MESFFTTRHCFKRVGMRVPSFLFRVYILLTEFERFSQRNSIQYPVPITTDFVLHVCNNSEPAIRGMARCLHVKDAYLSLQQRGHYLSSSSLLLLVNNSLNPIRSVDGQRRHLSMDASTSFLRSNSKDLTNPGYLSPGYRPLSRFDPSSTFLSQTPLLRSSPFFDTGSADDLVPEFSLSHQSSLMSPSAWHNRSLFSFNSPGSNSTSIINTINTPSERWNEPSLLNWRTETASVGVRQSIDSNTSHTSLLGSMGDFHSLDRQENSRSNSLGVAPNMQDRSSLSYSFLTPTLTTLSKSEMSDGYSLNDPPSLTFKKNEFFNNLSGYQPNGEKSDYPNTPGKKESHGMNPNSAEFIPTFIQQTTHHPREEKRPNKRESLVGEADGCDV